ncbi:FAD-dependent monooxygenase [Devosia sp. YIM 151766]|uniref:FAD-dependent monooxygenase n=1 Tax=Devosia sp. YIM 151766 TaxID=3017325 RepID=UPI00255CF4F6|nr:FAD-dependent monooxygenase [Devosia sp. YIM 151766]WIY51591.1 FAD-dependent monooxygenase [Devosia sp. YIM 151766]
MPATGRNYIIAGAGIAGMTLALALAKFGANILVLERSPHMHEFGAGLQISPNARHCLDRLGLSAALDAVSLEPEALDLYPQGSQSTPMSMELGAIMRERFGAPYAVMHRADLADLLYKACRRFANIDILFGVRHWDVVSHARGVTVAIDEADGQSRTSRAHAFIGADGVHSPTRRGMLAGPEAHFGNRIAWRALVPLDLVSGQIAPDRVSVFFGAGFHLVCYPLPSRRQANLALFMPAATQEPQGQPRPSGTGARAGAILTAAGSGWTPWPLFTVETSIWHRSNIGLIGDAAHAMVPFQAQGAAMGIEDATILAPLLVETKGAEDAFARYAALRQARVKRVAALSAQNGRIFHLPWPLSLARDATISAQGPRAHLRRLNWIYDYKADAIS